MANISSLEKRQFEDLFGMASGYVISDKVYSNATFAEFFRSAANIDIYNDEYAYIGGSKAKRLRAFWEKELDVLVGKVLHELLQVWEYENDNHKDNKAYLACKRTIERLNGKAPTTESNKDTFLERDFGEISFDKLSIEASMIPVVQKRYEEAGRCLKGNAFLSVIFLCGSILEGILLGTALANPAKFNQSKAAPKDKDEKVKKLHLWSLANFIDVACDIKILAPDIKKFGDGLRDFRNYIHPYEQMLSGFDPDKHTAKICLQVLNAAVANLNGER